MSVKLRSSGKNLATNNERSDSPPLIPIKPLNISALVITKQALIEALQIYLPGLRNLEILEGGADGERFLLTIEPTEAGPASSPPASSEPSR
jgi:hypothetical protein